MFIFSFYFLIVLIFFIPVSPLVPFTYAQEESKPLPNSTFYYGCISIVGEYECNLMLNEISGFNAFAETIKIHSISYEKDSFEIGVNNNALRLNAEYGESLVIQSDPINSIPFSVSFFIKPIDPPSPQSIILSNVGLYRNGWYIDMQTKKNETITSFNIYLDEEVISSKPIPLDKDQFSHIVVNFDGSSASLFKNGNLIQTMITDGIYDPPAIPFRIGSASWSSSSLGVSAIIDELYMFSRTLNNQEIFQLNRFNFTPDKDIIFYFPFDNDTKDYSGNNLDAKLNSMISSMVFSPDGRLFFTEKNSGNIRIIQNDTIFQEPFYRIDDFWVGPETGLLGITIDPNFTENGFVYFYYTYKEELTGFFYNKIVRVTDYDGIGKDPVVIFDKIPGDGGFDVGGALTFGPEDKLFVTVGDGTRPEFALDPNIYLGKILRINKDGSIPADNPYPNSPVYTIGHRNMYGIAFDPSGLGIVTENAGIQFDEINLISKGGNYGYPLFQQPNENPYFSDKSKSILPSLVFFDAPSPDPTQAIYYDGKKFPEYLDQFLFGTFTGHIVSFEIDNSTKRMNSFDNISVRQEIFYPIIGIAQSPKGDIYFGSYNIYKIDKIEKGEQFLFPVSVVGGTNTPPFEKMKVITTEKKMILYPILEKFEGEYQFKIPSIVSSKLESIVDFKNNTIPFSSFFDPDQMELNLYLFDNNNNSTSFSFAQIPDTGCQFEDQEKIGGSVGRIEEASGETLFKRYGDNTWRFTPNHLEIEFGDIISTVGKDSGLRIVFGERFEKTEVNPLIITIGPNTKLCIAEDSISPFGEKKGFFDLLQGQIRIWQGNKNPDSSVTLDVETGNYETSGLDIIISYDILLDKKTYHLNEGIVDVAETTDGKTITLNEDQSIEISRGKIYPKNNLKTNDWNFLVQEIGGPIAIIPDWVKNNAGWWAKGTITDSEFVLSLQFLNDQRILIIPPVNVLEEQEQIIPDWIKTNAGWWANDQINDNDFIKGIQFLMEHGIIRI